MNARPRRALVLAACALSLATLGSEFDGCGSAPHEAIPDGGRPLPGSTGSCVLDSDCGTDECWTLACVAGTCVQAGPRFDVDADGHAPAPCGGDCDDGDPNVFPGAAELCDARDQDCDTRIDEGAIGVRATELLDGLRNAEIVAAGDAFAVIGRDEAGRLAGYVLDTDGPRTPPRVLYAPPAPETVELASAAGDDTRILVGFALSSGPPLRLEVVREGDELAAALPPATIGATGDTAAIDVHVSGGKDWVVFDTGVGSTRRWLWRSDAATVVSLAGSDVPPALADDGARLVVTSGDHTLGFFTLDGAPAGTLTVPGLFATGMPLASAEGSTVVAYRDAFDHSLAAVHSGALGPPSTAPFGPRSDSLSVFSTTEGVLVVRASPAEVRAWIIADDLRTYLAAFSPTDLSPYPVGPSRVSAATSSSGISAILGAYDGASVAAFLSCETAP